MTTLILLFSIGILFVLVEVIIPGGILGVIGGLLMLAGCIVALVEYGIAGGLWAMVLAFVLTGIALWLQLHILPKTRFGRRAFLDSQITGVSTTLGDEAGSLVGKPAAAVTMLSPTGYVLIDGTRYEAFCKSGQVPAGTPLQVIGFDNFRLIVTSHIPTTWTTP